MIGLDPVTIAPFFSSKVSSLAFGAAAPPQLIPANSNRVLLILQSSVGDFIANPGATATAAIGIYFVAKSASLIIDFAKWGGVVGQDWIVQRAAAGVTVSVVEVIYYPKE